MSTVIKVDKFLNSFFKASLKDKVDFTEYED